MEGEKAEITRELARFAAATAYQDLPSAAVERSKLCILDWLGVTLAGSTQPLAGILLAVVEEMGGQAQATVLGRGLQTTALHAALVNGAMSHALDYDDTHFPSLVHASAPVVPGALALAEWKGRAGKDLLAAYILGVEVETRIGMAAGPAFTERGWHNTAIMGHFGAAAAAGKLLGLSPEAMARALGIAGTQAGGLVQSFGTMCKPLHPGKAAMNGLLAALLAQRGFTGAEDVVEGKRGFLAACVGGGDLSRTLEGLGHRYEVLRISFKPYAACHLTHPGIEALLELRRRYDLRPEGVAEIRCAAYPLLLEIAAKPEPQTGLEGKFSVQHCLAVALAEGQAQEGQFTDEKVRHPDLVALRGKVKVVPDPGLGPVQGAVAVTTADGREYRWRTEASRGNPENPMSAEEFENKFRSLAIPVLGPERAERVIALVRRLEGVEDAGQLAALCR